MKTAHFARSIKTGNGTSKSSRRNNPGHFFNGRPIQTKLTVNEPGDAFEQEADRVAGEVVNNHETKTNPDFFLPAVSPTVVQRACSACEEEKLHRKESGAATPTVTASVKQALSGPGNPLDNGTRNFMESRFGNDFGSVRIHNDSMAHRSSADINARAYTHGSHIVFGAGEYRPAEIEGKKLLAHELTHVLQQGRSVGILQRKFNFIQPTPVQSVNPVTVKYHQDRPVPRNQPAQQTKRNRSLGLTTAIIANKSIISVDDIFNALNFQLAGEEKPVGTFKCRAVTNTTVDVTAEETILTANSGNKWTGRFNDYPNSQCSGKTNIPVTVFGDPDAAAVETKVRKNEDEHVDDIKSATNDMNARITTIESKVGNGNSEASCKTDLLAKTGSDPGRAIGREFLRRLGADADARDRSSHNIPNTRNLPSDCSKIEFTFKP